MNKKFKLKSDYKPAGDQPKAIKSLVSGFKSGKTRQTLLGVTGSGKTFTVANVIEKLQKPTFAFPPTTFDEWLLAAFPGPHLWV